MMTIAVEKVRKEDGQDALESTLHTEWLTYVAGNVFTVAVMALGYDGWTYATLKGKDKNQIKVPYFKKKVFEF